MIGMDPPFQLRGFVKRPKADMLNLTVKSLSLASLRLGGEMF